MSVRPILDLSHRHLSLGRGYSSVGRATERHAADAGSIPRCSERFFSNSTFRANHLAVSVPFFAIAGINICAYVKDPVVHICPVDYGNTNIPACTLGCVARLCRSWLSPGEASRISYGRNHSRITHTVVKEKTKKPRGNTR